MGELLLELTSSKHRDYCRNDRWEQGDQLLYLRPYLGRGADDHSAITCRWPADHPTVIHRQSNKLSTSARDRREPRQSSAGALAVAAGQSPGKMAICGLLLPVTVRLPAGDRQEIADPVITAVQGHENRPATYRCANLKIQQKSGGHRSIYIVLGRRLYQAHLPQPLQYTVFLWIQPGSRIERGSTYPSKLIEPTVIESRFQPSLDLNPRDFRPWN